MPEAASIHLQTPLQDVPGLTTSMLKMLTGEGLLTLGDLIQHFPMRHEDRRSLGSFTGFVPGEASVCHYVRIIRTKVMRFGGRGGAFEAVVAPMQESLMDQELTLRWFGMPFLQKSLAVDMELAVYGRIKDFKGRLSMAHPEYEVLNDDQESAAIHTGRIVPIYRLRGGLKQKPLRKAIWLALEHFDPATVSDLLPPPRAGGEFAGMSRGRALLMVHRPAEMDQLALAWRYLALEEFYLMQLRVVRRRQIFRQYGGHRQMGTGRLAQAFVKALPFQLTAGQCQCLAEIRQDMADALPMNRILHGDVGSGKTVVAFAAMLTAVESGQQATLMAPTQILAEQHYQRAKEWLEPLGVRVAFRSGERKEDSTPLPLFQEVTAENSSTEPQVIIGTHALLYAQDSFTQLGLAVIDEQHKFGVEQRARLIAQGTAPDVLVMTATPIPRTLTLTLYGDLDVSTINERPKARGKVITAVREITKLDEVTQFVITQLQEGRQCYIVYPLIEESEKLDAGAALKGHEEWTQRLAPYRVGLLHGRMSAEAKESVMRQFRSGELQALVSTTVIEVGVDVPNATVMILHDAARFGLAQIHQLRGRIGRGSHTSYAILFVTKGDTEAKERLHILEETTDGFRIAEEDLIRRGPGDVLGRAQSGQAPLRFGDLLADTRLVSLARRLAERTLEEDPELLLAKHQTLRAHVGELTEEFAPMQ